MSNSSQIVIEHFYEMPLLLKYEPFFYMFAVFTAFIIGIKIGIGYHAANSGEEE